MKTFAYVCADPGIPVPGRKGASIHVASVCREFARCGLRGTVHALRAEGSTLSGFPVVPIRLPDFPVRASGDQRETRLFLSAFRPSVAADDACDFVYERYSLWHAGGLVRAREMGVPFILEVNSPLPDEARRHRGLSQRALADGLARLLMHEADGVVCVSERVADWVRGHRGTDRGVSVVPNGVDPDLFSPDGERETLPWPDADDDPVIAFAGSFRPWHAMDDLLEAFRRLRESGFERARLLCVGDGPLREDFERKALGMGLSSHVHVTGMVPHEHVARWLRRARVAVVPSPRMEDHYFSPLKLFEFLALGLPVVAADVEQVAAILGPRDLGLLYEPGRVDALAHALSGVLSSPDEADRMGRSGRRWVLTEATWQKRVERILEHVTELRDEERSSSAVRR